MSKNDENVNEALPKRGLLFDDELERSVVESIENEDFSSFRDLVLEKIVEADENGENGGAEGDNAGSGETTGGRQDTPFGPSPEEDAENQENDPGSEGGDSDEKKDGPGGPGDGGEEDAVGGQDDKQVDTPKFDSLDDLIGNTGTSVSVEYDGTEPSPIFGPVDTKPRDKWKVYMKNENGSAEFTYWSKQQDEENRIPPSKDEMVGSIARACSEYGNSMSPDQFKSRFGYEDCDSEITQRSYDGFRKLIDDLQVMFPDGEYEEFTRLGSETSEN